MDPRGIVVGLLLSLYIPNAAADKFQVATKGKKQTVKSQYGNLSCYDGVTLIFDEFTATFGSNSSRQKMLGEVPTVRTSVPVKDSEIVITVGARDAQEVVDGNHIESSRPGEAHDTDLQRAQLQQQAKKPTESDVAEFDLTHCSATGPDQIMEIDPKSAGKTKPPVLGRVQSIGDGIVTFQRKSDGAILKYRLDTLTEIKIGVCQ
jgi:hypothetical protein